MDRQKTPVVLMIEDDPLLVKMHRTKLVSEGFEVIEAHDGEEGLKLALERVPDIIILDIMMPKLSGTDLLRRLREDIRGKSIAVIVLSNLSQEEEIKRAMEYGVKEYLVKANFTPSQLVDKVKQYL